MAINIPGCFAPNQIMDLLSKSENIGRDRRQEVSLIPHIPMDSTFMAENEPIYICLRGYNVVDRDDFLIRYVFIGSKLNIITNVMSKLHFTAYALFYNAGDHNDFVSWLRREGYKLRYVEIRRLIESIDTIIMSESLIDEFNNLAADFAVGKSKKINALYGVYSCLLGKKLNPDNGAEWGRKCCRALLGTIGGDLNGHPIESIYPTVYFPNDYHSRISVVKELRKISYWFLREASKNTEAPEWQKDLCNSILLRLSWSDLTGFKLIYTYLLSSNRFMWLWGWLACNCYTLLKAVTKFISYDDNAPYLKLLSSNNENPEFNTLVMRRMAEVARLIGIIEGQKTLQRVNTGFKFENEEAVKEALEEILTAGDQGLYKWVLFAREHILPVKDNQNFYNVISHIDLINPNVANDQLSKKMLGFHTIHTLEQMIFFALFRKYLNINFSNWCTK